MKSSTKFSVLKSLAIAAALAATLIPGVAPASGSVEPSPEPRTIVVTLLGGAQRTDKTEVKISFDGTNPSAPVEPEVLDDLPLATRPVRSVNATDGRWRKLKSIEGAPAEVNCAGSDAECGSVELSGGTKIAACICDKTSRSTSTRIPPAIRAKLIGPIESGTACWEDKTKLLSVCWKIGTKPPEATQTKEHILLARQVGVPSL
jgi:hypothetical protein